MARRTERDMWMGRQSNTERQKEHSQAESGREKAERNRERETLKTETKCLSNRRDMCTDM